MFYFFIMKSFIFSLFVVLLFIYGIVSNIVYASINNKKSEEVLELYIDSYVINDIIDVSKYDDLEEKNKEKCILKILQKRKNLGDKNFNKKDAEILYEKISFYSKKHNINLKDGFIIVNVESDFNYRAFNRKGKAVGLTQITTPCLNEYNNLNRTKYELNQMFDIDLNLEVGFWYYNRLMKHYSKYSIYGINRFDDIEPIFVSRMPRRKVKGQAHMETIRGIEKENGKLKTITKTPLTKLKLDDNNEIKNYSKKAKQDDKLLYDALVEQLKKFDGKGEEAFKEPFFKPKKDGSKGPIVNTVKIEENATLGVEFKEGKAFAGNGNMVRIDVFYVEGEGYYFVPIYVANTIKKELPKNFIFSLYPNDLIYIESEKGIKLNGNNDNKKEQIEVKKLFAYYVKAGISVAQITIDNQDGEYTQPSLGIKGLKKIEKYDIDVLGNYHKIKLPEKRIKFNIN